MTRIQVTKNMRPFNDQILEKVCNPCDVLGHYTSCDTFMCGVLRSRKLRLNRLTKTNDPRETKEWSIPTESDDFEVHRAANKYLNEKLRKRCYVTCATMSSCSLDCFAKPRMWAQYASAERGKEHSGVCLLFDRTKLDTAVKELESDRRKSMVEEVKYEMEPPFENLRVQG